VLIFADRKTPGEAKAALSAVGKVVEFSTKGITYEAISGHPDIFFCPTPDGLVVAPNLPEEYLELIIQRGISFKKGVLPVGNRYPETSRYNALTTGNMLIHNINFTDTSIVSACPDFEIIHIKQGYTRCNLIALPNGTFITSDHGIEMKLMKLGKNHLFVDPSKVLLEGTEHGFFGGTCGLFRQTLFVCGSLNYLEENEAIGKFVADAGLRIVELYDGPPVDIGTIVFLSLENSR